MQSLRYNFVRPWIRTINSFILYISSKTILDLPTSFSGFFLFLVFSLLQLPLHLVVTVVKGIHLPDVQYYFFYQLSSTMQSISIMGRLGTAVNLKFLLFGQRGYLSWYYFYISPTNLLQHAINVYTINQ